MSNVGKKFSELFGKKPRPVNFIMDFDGKTAKAIEVDGDRYYIPKAMRTEPHRLDKAALNELEIKALDEGGYFLATAKEVKGTW